MCCFFACFNVVQQILLDGHDMAKLDIDRVRQQMAYVSQEPQLFSSSIAENIARGDCTRIVSDVRISLFIVNCRVKRIAGGY